MAERVFQIIYRTLSDGTGTRETKKALGEVQDAVKGLTGINIQSMLSIAGLGLLVKEVGEKVIQYYKEGTEKLLTYGEATQQFIRLSGMEAESAQVMMGIGERLGVQNDDLAKGMKNLAMTGMDPTIETLGRLSDQYLAIKDPAQQVVFLTKEFGKSGQEIGKLMVVGSAGLEKYGQAVAQTGILTAHQIEIINQLETATNRLNASQEENQRLVIASTANIQTSWKNALADELDMQNSYKMAVERLNEAKTTGLITDTEYWQMSSNLVKSQTDYNKALDMAAIITNLLWQRTNELNNELKQRKSLFGIPTFTADIQQMKIGRAHV